MKKKKEACKYCGGKMDAKTTRQEFCSDKCRVYWNRENKLSEKIDDFASKNKAAIKKANDLMFQTGVGITHIDKKGELRTIHPMSKEGQRILSKPQPQPIRKEGESALDFAARKNEWKKSQNSKP